MCAKVERLRDFVGLETSNMMRIVATAAEIIKKNKLVSGKQVNAAIVHKWLVENVNWGRVSLPRRPNSGEAHAKLCRNSEGPTGSGNH